MKGIIEIKSGEYKLLHSGVFITFNQNEIELSLTYKDETITLFLQFYNEHDEVNKGKLRTEFEQPDAQSLKVKFFNFNELFGMFNTDLLELGTIAEKRLFFFYYITKLKDTDRREISYSFYILNQESYG